MTGNGQDKLFAVLLDPHWKVGKITFDGTEHIFVTMQHPYQKEITWLVPHEVARLMGEALSKLGAK